MTDKKLEILWQEFGNIPINEDGTINTDFLHFKKGTDKFKIWHWFDNNHSIGLAKGLIKLKG